MFLANASRLFALERTSWSFPFVPDSLSVAEELAKEEATGLTPRSLATEIDYWSSVIALGLASVASWLVLEEDLFSPET